MTIKRKNSGFSLIEMVIYVSMLTIITVVVLNTVLSFTTTYKSLQVLRTLDHSSIDAMERMTRDIRAASSIDTTNSTLGSNPGVLSIITDTASGNQTTKFYLTSGVLKVNVGGVYSGPLTLSGATVTSLVFNRLQSGISDAVKIDMTVSATLGTTTKIKSYHSTIILKGQ